MSEQSVSEKQKAVKAAQDAVAQAIQALNEANAQLEEAKSNVFAKQQALAAAKENASAAEADLVATKDRKRKQRKARRCCQQGTCGLSAELAQAQEAYDAALTIQESARCQAK